MDALFAWLWQGTAIAVVMAIALRWIPRTSAATRHLAWWLTLAGVVALPLAPTTLQVLSPATGAMVSPVSAAAAASAWTLPAPPDWARSLAIGAWLGILLLGLVRVASGVHHVRQLARQGDPLPAQREAALPLWAGHRHTGREARLCVSTAVTMPCALGLGPATILLPRRMVDRLADEALDKIVMHERAHLVRYDDWTRLLQAVVTAVFGLHPVVLWIGRQLDVERETACDDLVVQAAGDPRAYASCLAEVASVAATQRAHATPSLAPGAMRSPGCLERRVRRLIDRRHNGTTAASRRFALAVAVGLVVAATVLAQAAPVVTFVEERAARTDAQAAPGNPVVTTSPGVESRPQPQPSASSAPDRRPPVSETRPSSRTPSPDPEPSLRPRPASTTATQPVTVHPALSSEADSQRHDESREQRVELPATLSVDIGVRPTPVDAIVPSGTNTPEAGGERSPWAGVAQAGVNVGTGAKKAGVAIAGFFSRAGQVVGSSF